MANEKEEIKGSEAKPEAEKLVTLKPEQYDALLDHIAELEAANAQPKKEKVTDLDALAEEGKPAKRKEREAPEATQADLDNMSNAELANFILQKGDEVFGGKLSDIAVAVETLKVMREIDKAETKYDDFWQYEGRIKDIGSKNPGLSIEQAYRLAKSEKGEKATEKTKKGEEEEVPATRTEKLLKLPPRTSGEKPGLAPGASKETEKVKTLKDAAHRAWDDVVGKGKTEL